MRVRKLLDRIHAPYHWSCGEPLQPPTKKWLCPTNCEPTRLSGGGPAKAHLVRSLRRDTVRQCKKLLGCGIRSPLRRREAENQSLLSTCRRASTEAGDTVYSRC